MLIRPPEAVPLCVKPLPRVPSRWSRFCDQLCLFLRSIKLGIVVVSVQGLFKRRFKEPTKTAISRNRLSALLRSLIHIPPLAVALFEIVLNLRGTYVGISFDQQTSLQFAAKAHEIVVQASLATAFLSYIRYQITIGDGLPFGALLGSVEFLQVSYLWSAELWSAVLSKQFARTKRFVFAVTIIIFAVLAATVGPSSATLLIPRQSFWNLEPFQIALNDTFDVFWPDALNGAGVPTHCAVIDLRSQQDDPLCPLSDFAPALKTSTPMFAAYTPHDQLVAVSTGNAEVLYSKIIYSSLCGSASRDQYCATSPQEVFYQSMTDRPPIGAAGYLQNDPTTWIDSYLVIQDDYYQPYTIASCVSNQYNGTTAPTTLRFARLSQTQAELQPNMSREIFPVSSLAIQQVFSTPGNASQYQSVWIDLPHDKFNTPLPGIALIHPRNLTQSAVYITTCTLNAGWGSTELMEHTMQNSRLFSHRANAPDGWPSENSVDVDVAGFIQPGWPDFANFSGSLYPEKRIIITKDWLELLNPIIELFPGQNSTAIDTLLSALGDEPSEELLARTVSSMLASGLARTGLTTEFNSMFLIVPSGGACNLSLTTIIPTDLAQLLLTARPGKVSATTVTQPQSYVATMPGHTKQIPLAYSSLSLL